MSEMKIVDIGDVRNDEEYRVAMVNARRSGEHAMYPAQSAEQRAAWARTGQLWLAIAREIREERN